MNRRIWTVSELVGELNSLLEQGFAGLAVDGEVTNASVSGRGHLYFTLKDGAAALDCVMWGSRAERLRFRLEDGLAVRALGSLGIYPQRGRLQMVVEALEPQGLGALQLAFDQLKQRLAAEGLFAPERKRALPVFPRRIGIVTSRTGAALRDMLKVLRRTPFAEVLLAHAQVQGEGAAEQVAVAVDRLGASGLVDVVIVARGGGSLEDLWAFNEEPVARAIAACPVPVVSGVGHETDVSIADFVADLRAATPTQAAELVAERLDSCMRRVDDAGLRLARDLRRHLGLARARLEGLEGSSGLARLPHRLRLAAARLERADRLAAVLRRRLDRLHVRTEAARAGLRRLPGRVAAGGHRRLLTSRRELLVQLMRSRLDRLARGVAASERSLGHLGPLAVLERGYSITTLVDDSAPLKEASKVRPGQVISTRLAHGELRSIAAPGERPRSGSSTPTAQATLFGDEPGQPVSRGAGSGREGEEEP